MSRWFRAVFGVALTRQGICVLFGVAAAWIGLATPSAAQGSSPDPAMVKRGQSLYRNRGCEACHRIGGGKAAGPDLRGVTERRDPDWLRRWLKNTNEMLETDSIARALLEEYKGVRMPAQKLTDQDVEALLVYIAQASAQAK
jgi:mono/diheme cytochrome c family protein